MEPVLEPGDLGALQQAAARIAIEDSVADYLLALVEATRRHPSVRLGVSPRGALAFLAVTRGRALLHGRDFVTPDDVKALAEAALAHRLILNWHHASPAGASAGHSKAEVVQDVLQHVAVPR